VHSTNRQVPAKHGGFSHPWSETWVNLRGNDGTRASRTRRNTGTCMFDLYEEMRLPVTDREAGVVISYVKLSFG
jgi:hypothetical protein